MNVAARVQEILAERKREIRDQIDGLVSDVSYQLEDEGIDGAEIHRDVVEALRNLLADPATFPEPTPEEKRELRAVSVHLTATMTVDADCPEDLEEQLDDIRSQARNFGCDSVSVTGDYATAPRASLDSEEDE